MYVYSCNALSARFFAVDRALNSYFMIMIMVMSVKCKRSKNFADTVGSCLYQSYIEQGVFVRRGVCPRRLSEGHLSGGHLTEGRAFVELSINSSTWL